MKKKAYKNTESVPAAFKIVYVHARLLRFFINAKTESQKRITEKKAEIMFVIIIFFVLMYMSKWRDEKTGLIPSLML